MYPMKAKCWKLKNACNVPVRSHSPQESFLIGEQMQFFPLIKNYLPDAELGQATRPVLSSKPNENMELDLVKPANIQFWRHLWDTGE